MLTLAIIYSWFVIITLQGVVASPLPRENERNITDQHVFSSTQFKDTDDICIWLFQNWITGLAGRGARRTGGVSLPLVISQHVTISHPGELITFDCGDHRTDAVLRDAVLRLGEVEHSDTYFLKCNESDERAKRKAKLSNSGSNKSLRSSGVCETSSATKAGTSTRVPAGGSACLDAEGQAKMDRVLAYLDSDDYGDDRDPTDAQYVEWMNILQLGTLRHEYVAGKSSVAITVDHRTPSIYRACAKLRPGVANARLYVTSV